MAFKHNVVIVTSITRIIGISNASTGLFFCQKYKVNTINVNAASIWLLAPNMGQSTHATCLASVELGRDTFTKTSNIAGIIAAMVPLANMFGYVNNLRSMSQGRAQYSMFFDHYEKVPQNVQDEVTKKLA